MRETFSNNASGFTTAFGYATRKEMPSPSGRKNLFLWPSALAYAKAEKCRAVRCTARNFAPLATVFRKQPFRNDEHAYAITAGHYATDNGNRVRDTTSGVAGTFVRAIVDPPHSGGSDYGLVDFGSRAIALPFIGNLPTATGLPHPQPGQRICRTGVSSGQHCGTIGKTYGDDQYLTDDMPRSIPGDSGGPVWIPRDDGRAQIIGIWLGDNNTAAGNLYGRFASLAGGLDSLGLN
jgi:hypothetical protein